MAFLCLNTLSLECSDAAEESRNPSSKGWKSCDAFQAFYMTKDLALKSITFVDLGEARHSLDSLGPMTRKRARKRSGYKSTEIIRHDFVVSDEAISDEEFQEHRVPRVATSEGCWSMSNLYHHDVRPWKRAWTAWTLPREDIYQYFLHKLWDCGSVQSLQNIMQHLLGELPSKAQDAFSSTFTL